ncbi:protein of unknown function [Burkholderia multivorans]
MDLKSTIDSIEYNILDFPMRGPPAARAPASTRSSLIFMDFQLPNPPAPPVPHELSQRISVYTGLFVHQKSLTGHRSARPPGSRLEMLS